MFRLRHVVVVVPTAQFVHSCTGGGGGGAPAIGQVAADGAPGICTIASIAMFTSALDRRAYRSCGAIDLALADRVTEKPAERRALARIEPGRLREHVRVRRGEVRARIGTAERELERPVAARLSRSRGQR